MRSLRPILLVSMLLLTACTPAAVPGGQSSQSPRQEQEAAPAAPKTLTIALENEPTDPFVGSIHGGAGTIAGNMKLAVHQWLANYDDRGGLHPMLATELPTREAGSWVVRPDGTMQTTYRIRPDVTWHDGSPLTSRDFVFGWTVAGDSEVPMRQRQIVRRTTRIEAPDDHTIVIEWSAPYPFAGAMANDEIGPLPSHLLESIYSTDKERFNNHAYWTREFVGVGPFRMDSWEAGSHFTLRAYDRFYRGRPKLDTIVVRFIPDPATAVANLLAGSIDGAIPRTLDFSDVIFVKEEWERAGQKPLAIIQPTHLRVLEPQFRDPSVPEILDVRFRRALLHAIDRQALVDVLLAGTIPVADSIVPPDDVKYEWVKDAIVRYPHDTRRAHELLAEVGWRRDGSGNYLNVRGERAVIPLATSQGRQAEQEQSLIADNWRSLGLGVEQQVRSAAEARDNRMNSIFPGYSASAGPLTFEHIISRVHSVHCPTDQNRWTGANHGCYRSAQHDRVVDEFQTAIDAADQRRLYAELAKILTEDLAYYPLYYNPQAMIFREGVVGVKGDTKPRTNPTWNSYEWDLR